ncbi:MAG: rRNA maturation RNase YbeY [Gammaproteobacteria bacterium]|jgi:probable rRNA maturation factor|nr:rRNA maturation RNase YbeY [Gammaproteobacteria bacterium]
MTQAPTLDLTLQVNDTSLNTSESQFSAWCLETLRYATIHSEALQQHPAWEITVRIVDTEEGKSLNANYRHKEYATNVLSFYYDDPFADLNFLEDEDEIVSEKELGQGDIVLCAPVILKEAAEQKKSIVEHTAHLIVHATLHLMGYDHEIEKDARIMENLEIVILQQLGFNNPYEEI